MATDLTNVAVSTGYVQLLHIDGGVGGSVTRVYDGDGTGTPLQISTSEVQILDGSYNFDVASHDGTNGLKLGGTLVTSSAAELNYNDISTLGTAQASKVLTVDSSLDVTGIRNLTATGTVQAANFTGTGNTQIGDAAADTVAMNATITTNLIFEGSTANAYETTLAITDPTADRTWTIPDSTDTFVGKATSDTLTNKILTAPDINTPDIDGGTVDAITTLTVANSVDIGNYTLTANGLTIDGTFTDGSLSIASGSIASAVNGTFSGTVQAEQLTTTDDLTVSGLATIGETLAVTGVATFTAQSVHNGGLSTGALVMNDGSITDTSGTINFGNENLTSTGVGTFASLDISGNADIDGTMEADAYTVDGTTLAEYIADTAGAMVSSNTESGITVTYQDGDNTVDLSVDAAQTGITSIYATDLILGEDSQTAIDFGTANEIDFKADNAARLTLTASALYPVTDNQIDLGTSSLEFKDAFFDGTVTSDTFTDGTLSVASGSISSAVNGTFSGTVQAEQLTTTDDLTVSGLATIGETLAVTGVATFTAQSIHNGGMSTGALVLNDGSVTDTSGAISFGNENLTTTGTLGAGATTVTSLSATEGNITNVGDIALDSISADTTDINVAVSDNSATAFTVKQGTDAYLIVDTANTSESVAIGTGISGTAVSIGHGTSETVVNDNLTVTGDLTVSGTTTTVSSGTLTIGDTLIKLGQAYTGSAYDQGIVFTRGDGSSTNTQNMAFIWDESADTFAAIKAATEAGTTSGNVTVTDHVPLRVGALTADDASTFTSTISTATGSTIGNLTLANGSITDSSGAIDFGNENLSTSGTLGAGVITATGLTIGSAVITEAELEILDGASLSTTELNYVDGVTSAIQTQIDTKAPLASPTFTGTITIGSAGISETELEILDGLTVTTAELNIMDADTVQATVTLAATDGVVISDGTVMKQALVSDFEVYMEANLDTMGSQFTSASSLATVGTIGTGTWEATDVAVAHGGTGASTLTDGGILLGSGTSAITATAVLGDGEILIGDGTTDPVALDIGSSTAVTTLGTITTGVWNAGAVTSSGVGTFASLDISGAIDVDGVTNLDVVDIDGAVDMASTLTVIGNVGIGAAPSAWNALHEAIQFGNAGIAYRTSNNTLSIMGNAYYESSGSANPTYLSNNEATELSLSDGAFVFRSASASTGTISWSEKMRIDSAGTVTLTGVTTKLSSTAAQLWIGEGDGATDLYFSKGDTNEEVRFSKNGGGDLDILTNAATLHLDQDGEGYYSGGNFGIGGTPASTTHLQVNNDTINTSSDFYGIYANHTKTLGTSSVGDLMTGIRSYMVFNDADAAYSNVIAGSFEAIGQSSSGECVGIIGIDVTASFAAGDINSIYGAKIVTDINGGTIDSSAYGIFNQIDLESGVSGSFSNYGYFGNVDSDTDVATYGVYYEGASNQDYHWVGSSSTVGSITSRISDAGLIEAKTTTISGLDYAEYFESKDGKSIAVGMTVKLDGDKIVACSDGDTPIGVVRPLGSSGVIGGDQPFHWQGKHEKDVYGGVVMEDFTKTKWETEVDEAEYVKRKDEKEQRKYKRVEGSEAIPAVDAVTQQKTVDEEVEEEVTTAEVVLEDGKYVQKTTTETVTKTVKVPQYNEVDLYDKDGEVIGKHQVPIMETVEEAVAAVDAVADTYFRKHKYYSDRIPDGLTAPDDAEVINRSDKRPKLNSSYDASKEESYKSREERDEWHIVGLLGQIPITKGQPMADSWIKMKDVSDTVEMYFVK